MIVIVNIGWLFSMLVIEFHDLNILLHLIFMTIPWDRGYFDSNFTEDKTIEKLNNYPPYHTDNWQDISYNYAFNF